MIVQGGFISDSGRYTAVPHIQNKFYSLREEDNKGIKTVPVAPFTNMV